jgi:hypothetical protein
MSISGLELGGPPDGMFGSVDTSRFLIPTTLLQPPSTLSPTSSLTESPILPLLRCLGVPNAMRLLSALLSERRVLLISSSPTRLSTSARSVLSIIGQGMLHWQHLFIPVLPPHLFQYLAAPVPYLMGILTTPQLQQLLQQQELGEVLLIYLDTNVLETRGIPTPEIAMRIPDLFQNSLRSDPVNPGVQPETTAAEFLANDLLEILKNDKKLMTGESALQSVGETAAKATKAVKGAFNKLKNKGKAYLQQRSSSMNEYDSSTGNTPPRTPPPERSDKAVTADEIYAEGCQNPVGEEEACIAFTAFFLNLYGDLRWYLGSPGPDGVPQFDRMRFLQQKRAMGDGEGTPVFPLLQNMIHSQMFEQFVKERVEEIRTRTPVTKESPLFLVCTNYLRGQQASFTTMNVRNVSRQMAQSNPRRVVTEANAMARRLAMNLTSNKTYEGNQGQAIAQLVEVSHEASSVLFDVMSVLWTRISDSKGMQWKHGLLALQIMKNLLYHGPLAAVSEATDGLDKIRALKGYNDSMRQQAAKQIQVAAIDIYVLLVDRVKLFSIRRVCADRRRAIKSPPQARVSVFEYTYRLTSYDALCANTFSPLLQLIKDTRLRVTIPFKSIHAALHPNSRRQVAPVPGGARPGVPATTAPAPEQDLLGFSSPPQQNGQPAGPPAGTGPPRAAVSDTQLLGLFDKQAKITSAPGQDPFAATPPRAASAAQSAAPAMQHQNPPFASPPPQAPPTQPAFSSPPPQPTAPNQHQASPQAAAPRFASPPPQVQACPPQAPQGPPQQSSGTIVARQPASGPPPQYMQQQQTARPAPHPQPVNPGIAPQPGFAPQQRPQPPQNYAGMQSPPPPRAGYQAQQRPMPPATFHQQQHAPPHGQPQQQQANPFAAPPPQAAYPQQPPRANMSQFDPMAKNHDPFQ